MPQIWRFTRLFQRPLFIFLPLFWLLTGGQHFVTAAALATIARLYCMSCVRVESDTTVLDQFRVRQGLPLPVCEMEPLECEPHQDTCVTISMQITQRQYWVGSGCDQRLNYDFPSGGRDGCVELPAIYRNFLPGFMEERRTLQRLCLCSSSLCNGNQRPQRCSFLTIFIFLLIILFIINERIFL
ncbi:hypothetical protein Mgra_00006075 [Meloidogyne graminicola]|uniref:Uncharacterized protein n=1 Tax=Meloidogyne graminicola TaxID=189291 RepID=A0A8S9ZM70_9BILA|nr:hypothetical protein Mgra_00006075 [Meloidogyne graminicola]